MRAAVQPQPAQPREEQRGRWVPLLQSFEDFQHRYCHLRVEAGTDKDGKPIKCEGSKCEGDFDWTWTQHTAWRINEKSKKGDVYLTVFDNGDGRGMEQPALADMKTPVWSSTA